MLRGLRSFAGRKYGLRGSDFVDEVVFLTHLDVIKNLADYNPGRAAFLTWAIWRLKHVASNLIRKGSRRKELSLRDNRQDFPVSPKPGPSELAELERRNRVIREELKHLPDDCRAVIETRYFCTAYCAFAGEMDRARRKIGAGNALALEAANLVGKWVARGLSPSPLENIRARMQPPMDTERNGQ